MMSIMSKVSIALHIVLISFILHANMHARERILAPERLFRMTGSEINISEGDLLYKSQAAGYYTGGGGVVVRSPVESTQFASVHIPQIQAGCGGIDIYTGGFSFINGKQLTQTLQAIASNSAGFAFMLGLETVSPQIANNVKQLQSWANTVNGIGINSCETAAQLVGSVWPANDMASQHICRTIGTSERLWSDYGEARHHCSGKMDEQKKNEIKKYNPLGDDCNIIWEALMAQPFFQDKNNKELAEMYMTMVGTFIIKEGKAEFKFAKAEDNTFLQRLLEGGDIGIYRCKDDKCLVVIEEKISLSPENCWITRIRNSLLNMQQKAREDQPLNNEEKGLLATSRLPLYRIINVMTAYHRGQPCVLEINNIADIVAWDVLAQVLNEAIEAVRRGCIQLRATSMYDMDISRCLEDLERIRIIVKKYEETAIKAIDLEMRLIQKLQLLEKKIQSEIIIQ